MSRSPHEPKILASKPVCEPLTFVGALEGTTVGFTDGCELGTWGTHCTRPAQRRQTQVERMHGFGLSAAQDQNSKDGFLTWVGLSVEGAMVGACQAARHNRVSRAVRGGDTAQVSLGGWLPWDGGWGSGWASRSESGARATQGWVRRPPACLPCCCPACLLSCKQMSGMAACLPSGWLAGLPCSVRGWGLPWATWSGSSWAPATYPPVGTTVSTP